MRPENPERVVFQRSTVFSEQPEAVYSLNGGIEVPGVPISVFGNFTAAWGKISIEETKDLSVRTKNCLRHRSKKQFKVLHDLYFHEAATYLMEEVPSFGIKCLLEVAHCFLKHSGQELPGIAAFDADLTALVFDDDSITGDYWKLPNP